MQNKPYILTLYSYDGKSECKHLISAYGHTFLSIENTTDAPADFIENTTIEAGETLFFSWWAIDAHMGLWFNIEPNFITKHGRFSKRISKSIPISEADLYTIIDFLTVNDTYTPRCNCAKNCLTLFNLCSEEKFKINFFTGPRTVSSMLKKSKHNKQNPKVSKPSEIFFLKNGKPYFFEMEENKNEKIY